MSTPQVVIIGAGPTGLTTALLLAEYGVASVVLERNAAPLSIPRAIILDDEGARVLQTFGADATYVSKTLEADGAAYLDDDGNAFARIGAGPETYGFAKRHFISQPEMEAALQACLASNPLCEVRFGTEVIGLAQLEDGVTLTLTAPDGATSQIEAPFVVAADGGRSPTRDWLGIAMSGSTYEQDWIVLDTLNDPDPARFSKFFCSVTRPHVAVPAPNGGKRYEFMLLPGETPEDVLELEFLRGLLAPYRSLEPKDLLRKTVYTFHARIAERFHERRVFLAGDAAHLTPPFAGQGMNAGLRDAANLSWKLACVLRGGADPESLASYFDERRDPAWAMIQLAVVMGDVVMPLAPAQQTFRAQLLKAIAPFPAVQDYLLKMKFKPRPRYDQGLFVDLDDQPYEASIVGEMIPQPDVQAAGGTVKLDNLLGSGFALIAQDAEGEEALASFGAATLGGLPLARLVLATGAKLSAPDAVTKDDRAKPLRTHRDQILLIRPDRYCAAAFAPEALATGLAKFEALLGLSGESTP